MSKVSKQFDVEYHRKKVVDVMNSYSGDHIALKLKMSRCYDYFHGIQDASVFQSVYDSFSIKANEKTLELPIIHMSFNKIRGKIKSIIGDLIDMGFEAHVEAVNNDAKVRKYDAKKEMLSAYELRPYIEYASAETGIDYGMDNEIPEDYEEFKEQIESYKDLTEIAMESCLRVSLQNQNYIYTRLQLFIDAVIGGECHASTKIINGEPCIARYNPFDVYYPINVNDNDFLDKTNGMSIVYYTDIHSVLREHNISKADFDVLEKKYQSGDIEYQKIPRLNNRHFPFYQNDNSSQCLVVEHYWMDTKKVAGVTRKDKNGNETFSIDTNNNNGDSYVDEDATISVERKKIGVLRKATLIAGFYMANWGEVENQYRYPQGYAKCMNLVTSYRPFYINGRSTSEVDSITKIQDFRDYILTKMQLEITKSGGNVIAVDVSKLPADWGDPQTAIKNMLYYMKSMGVVTYDSSQGEIPDGNAMPIDRFDIGIGSVVSSLIGLIQFLDNEMNEVSGINDSRMGNIQNNQLSSVTAMMLNQSNKISKYLLNGFLEFESRLLTKHSQQIKTTWETNPDRWVLAIGDFYMDFLQNDSDLTLDDHSIIIKQGVISRTDLKQYLMAGIEHGMPIEEALEIEMLAIDDIKGALNAFIKNRKKSTKELQAMQQNMQAQQQEAMMAQQQAVQQSKLSMIDRQGENERQKVDLKGNFDLKKVELKNQKEKKREFDDYPSSLI